MLVKHYYSNELISFLHFRFSVALTVVGKAVLCALDGRVEENRAQQSQETKELPQGIS